MSELPISWQYVSLEQICNVVMGQSPDSSTYNEEGKGLPFFQGKAEFGRLHPTVRKWCTDPKKIAELGDVLLSIRAPVGPSNIASEKCIIGRGLAALRAIEPVHQDYIFHLIRQLEPWLGEQGTGSTFAAVSGEFVRSIEIPLAPINEQKRIVDKLDAVLARVDACRDRLDQIPVILKRFRQSVLATAMSGQLTADWRSKEGQKHSVAELIMKLQESKVELVEAKKINKDLAFSGETNFDSTIPNEWALVNLASICSKITDGEHITPRRTASGKWLISARNVINSSIKLDVVDFVDDEEFLRLRKRCDPQIGDILISCSGSVGRIALVDKDDAYVMVRSAAMIRPLPDFIDVRYLCFSLQSLALQKQIEDRSKSTAQANLFLGEIKQLVTPYPPLAEQHEIIRRVESLFAYADSLEARYTAARAQVEKLPSALLAKAFRGELVPQDPSDEPASELLARIAAAKPLQTKKKATRKPS